MASNSHIQQWSTCDLVIHLLLGFPNCHLNRWIGLIDHHIHQWIPFLLPKECKCHHKGSPSTISFSSIFCPFFSHAQHKHSTTKHCSCCNGNRQLLKDVAIITPTTTNNSHYTMSSKPSTVYCPKKKIQSNIFSFKLCCFIFLFLF